MPKVAGAVERKTILTQMIGTEEAARLENGNGSLPDAFEYMETLSPEAWNDCIGYLYRMAPLSPTVRGSSYIAKFTSPWTIEDVRQKFGGTKFRIIIKKGQERVCDTVVNIEAPPIFATELPSPAGAPSVEGAGPTSGSFAESALRAAANPATASAAVELTRSAAVAGFDLIRQQMQPQMSPMQIIEMVQKLQTVGGGHGGGLSDQMMQAFMLAMVQRMTQDPIEQMAKMMALMREVMGKGEGGPSAPDWKTALVQSLPQVADAGVNMMTQWSMAVRGAAQPPPRPMLVASPVPHPNPNAPTMPAPPAQQNTAVPEGATMTPGEPPQEWVKMKVVEMFSDPEITGGDVGNWLQLTAPSWLKLLDRPVEELLRFIPLDPVLAQMAGNPRLPQFLKEFVEWLHEEDKPQPGEKIN